MSEDENKSQIESMRILVELSKQRTRQSAERSYLNSERTLSVWLRTALGVMIFGIAIDRFELFVRQTSTKINTNTILQNAPFSLIGVLLILFSIFLALTAGLRFIGFSKEFKKQYSFPIHQGPSLPIVYTFLIILFGAALLFLILFIR